MGWLEQTWKYIQEDKAEQFSMLLNIAPLARTPMDAKGGRSLEKYAKKLHGLVEKMTPWRKKAGSLRKSMQGKVKPGEVVVLLDDGDTSALPLYKGAKTLKE